MESPVTCVTRLARISEQNRMLGVNGAVSGTVNFTVGTGQQGDGNINWDIEGSVRTIRFVPGLKNVEEPIPKPSRQYSGGGTKSYPRLLEYKPSDPAPFPSPPNPGYEPPPSEPQRLRRRLDVSPLFDPTDQEFRQRRTELDDPRFAEATKPWWKRRLRK
jgi:hypothetical protein